MSRPAASSLQLEHLAVDLDLVTLPCSCILERCGELVLVRRRDARDPETAVGSEDAEAPAGGLRAVDEEVDEAVRRLGRGRLWRTELEQGALQLVDSLAGRARDAKDANDPRVVDTERRRVGTEVDLVQNDRLRARLEPGAVRGQLGV